MIPLPLHLLRELTFTDLRSAHFIHLCELLEKGVSAVTTKNMFAIVNKEDAETFHKLFTEYKSPKYEFRRFARGPRRTGYGRRPSSSVAELATSYAYYAHLRRKK